jgi:hypothetical protein
MLVSWTNQMNTYFVLALPSECKVTLMSFGIMEQLKINGISYVTYLCDVYFLRTREVL